MRILRIIGSMNPANGGPGQGIRHSIAELAKLGVYNEVVSLDDPADDFLTRDTFPIHALGKGKGPWQYNAALLPWLENNLERFDALIVHGLWIYTSYAVWKAIRHVRKKRGSATVPSVYSMPHGMLDPYFQRSNRRRLKAIRNVIYWKLIEHKVVNDANGILFTSDAERLLAREPFRPYKPQQEINVGYGIPAPPAFTSVMQDDFRARCPGLHDEPYLLFFGRIHYKKGVDLLLEAYANLVSQPPMPDTRIPPLVIAGPGLDTDYGQQMQQRVANDAMLRDRVFFPGMLTDGAKWGALYGCQAFVLPSHQENFGIAVVEALACGKPVLISNQVNIWREIVSQGGGYAADNSPAGTEQLLRNWLQLSTDEQEAVGERAYQVFERNFAIDVAARRLLTAVSQRIIHA